MSARSLSFYGLILPINCYLLPGILQDMMQRLMPERNAEK